MRTCLVFRLVLSGSTGAVTGDHAFLTIVTIAAMSPPITPSAIHGPATAGSKAVRTWDHTQAAGTATRNSRNAALFTVPSSVMAGAGGARPRAGHGFRVRAGVEGGLKAILHLLLKGGGGTAMEKR